MLDKQHRGTPRSFEEKQLPRCARLAMFHVKHDSTRCPQAPRSARKQSRSQQQNHFNSEKLRTIPAPESQRETCRERRKSLVSRETKPCSYITRCRIYSARAPASHDRHRQESPGFQLYPKPSNAPLTHPKAQDRQIPE